MDETYEDGIMDGLKRAVAIAERTSRGKTAADAIMREIVTRQLAEDVARKQAAEESIRKFKKNIEQSFAYRAGLMEAARQKAYEKAYTDADVSVWEEILKQEEFPYQIISPLPEGENYESGKKEKAKIRKLLGALDRLLIGWLEKLRE